MQIKSSKELRTLVRPGDLIHFVFGGRLGEVELSMTAIFLKKISVGRNAPGYRRRYVVLDETLRMVDFAWRDVIQCWLLSRVEDCEESALKICRQDGSEKSLSV